MRNEKTYQPPTTYHPPSYTRADVRDAILVCRELPADVAVGVARVFDQIQKDVGPLDAGVVTAKALRGDLLRHGKSRFGLPERLWRKVRKTISLALHRIALERVPRRGTAISEEWLEPLRHVQSVVRHGVLASDLDALRRFARWCSANGVGVRHVRQCHFDAFEYDLSADFNPLHARDKFLCFCSGWSRAKAALPDVWPQVTVEWKLRRLWETKPLTAYPLTLQTDIETMLKARRDCDQDALSPWRAPIAPITERAVRYQLRQLLHAICKAQKLEPTDLPSFLSAFTPDNLDAALLELAGSKKIKKFGKTNRCEYLYGLVVEARNIVRNHLLFDTKAIEQFDTLVKTYNPRILGRCERSHRVIMTFSDDQFIQAVKRLPEVMLSRYGEAAVDHGQRARLAVEAALAAYTGVILALPLSELVSLGVGEDFIVHDAVDHVQYRVRDLYGSPTSKLLDMPDDWVRLLRLHAGMSGVDVTSLAFLFPDPTRQRPRHPSSLSRRVGAVLKNECRLRITAGYLRDLAGFLRLHADPTDVGGTADMLGHLKDAYVRESFGLLIDREVYDEHDASIGSVPVAATHAGRSA